jgi:hypothetical protein
MFRLLGTAPGEAVRSTARQHDQSGAVQRGNLFARPNAFRSTDPSIGQPILEAYAEVNELIKQPIWAWLRKNRGTFDREPQDATESVEIIAGGRGD